jgi:CRP/FNR family transcriptional regulator, cyclic AMP receptor protein
MLFNLLEKSRVFEGCTTQELEDVATICERVAFKNGTTIFEAESQAESLYIVCKGAVELRCNIPYYLTSVEITIDRKQQGDIFGWSALAKPHLYTLSAVAVKDSELLNIKRDEIEKLCTENNHLGYVLMKNIVGLIAQRFPLVQRTLIDETRKELKERVRWASRWGKVPQPEETLADTNHLTA